MDRGATQSTLGRRGILVGGTALAAASALATSATSPAAQAQAPSAGPGKKPNSSSS